MKKYEQKLFKRRQTAEELLLYKDDLLKKERELKHEEKNISLLIEEAMRANISPSNTPPHHTMETAGTECTMIISEEFSHGTPAEYNTDTFEVDTEREAGGTPLTSTPGQPQSTGEGEYC